MRLRLLMSASLTLLWMTYGCAGDRHHLQTNGQTGISLGEGKFAFPNKNGELIVGKAELPPGAMVRMPKTAQEVIDTLKDAGVKFQGEAEAP